MEELFWKLRNVCSMRRSYHACSGKNSPQQAHTSATTLRTRYFRMETLRRRMFGICAKLPHLRVIGSVAHVDMVGYKDKTSERTWREIVVGYDGENISCRVYKPGLQRAIKMRNIRFIEAPSSLAISNGKLIKWECIKSPGIKEKEKLKSHLQKESDPGFTEIWKTEK